MFRGAMVALVTPFQDDNSIDEDALRRLVSRQIEGGIDVLIPCGTTGESPTLSEEEQFQVIKIVVEEAKGRVPVVAGAGTNSTSHTVSLSKRAKEAGAKGLLIVTPYYNKPTPDGLVAHYKAIAKAAPLPIIFYHVPGRTALSVSAETLEKIAQNVPEVIAVKEATGDMNVLQAFSQRLSGRLTFLTGDDGTTLPFYALGGEGTISVTANVAPAQVASVWDLYSAGNLEKARNKHYDMLPLHNALFLETNPIPVKAALAMMKQIKPHLRLPLVEISEKNQKKLRQVLVEKQLLP